MSEHTCKLCGRGYDVIWFSEIWNIMAKLIHYSPKDTLCMDCFDRECQKLGVLLRWETVIITDALNRKD